MISAFAQSIEWLIILMGAVTGTSIAYNDIIFMTYLAQYFDKRLFIASGIVTAGATLGLLLLPHVYLRFADCYGTRGSFIIVAGLLLNMCIAGALLRPVEGKSQKTNVANSKTDHQLHEDENFISIILWHYL